MHGLTIPSSPNHFITRNTFHCAKNSGNFGRKSNGKVVFGSVRPQNSGPPLEVGPILKNRFIALLLFTYVGNSGKEYKMVGAIPLDWLGLIGKCRSIGYSHWSLTSRSGIMEAPIVSHDNHRASRTSVGNNSSNNSSFQIVGTAVSELVLNIELSTVSDIQAALRSEQVFRDVYSPSLF